MRALAAVSPLFAVFHARGPAWDASRTLEQQAGWDAHAAFMDALAADGFIAVGGPLEGSGEAMLIVRAGDPDEAVRRLAPDPWKTSGHLVVRACWHWDVRLGTRP